MLQGSLEQGGWGGTTERQRDALWRARKAASTQWRAPVLIPSRPTPQTHRGNRCRSCQRGARLGPPRLNPAIGPRRPTQRSHLLRQPPEPPNRRHHSWRPLPSPLRVRPRRPPHKTCLARPVGRRAGCPNRRPFQTPHPRNMAPAVTILARTPDGAHPEKAAPGTAASGPGPTVSGDEGRGHGYRTTPQPPSCTDSGCRVSLSGVHRSGLGNEPGVGGLVEESAPAVDRETVERVGVVVHGAPRVVGVSPGAVDEGAVRRRRIRIVRVAGVRAGPTAVQRIHRYDHLARDRLCQSIGTPAHQAARQAEMADSARYTLTTRSETSTGRKKLAAKG